MAAYRKPVKPAVPASLLARGIAYGLMLLYLPLDLIAFHGPLWHLLDRGSRSAGWQGAPLEFAERPAAVIFGSMVTLREVDQRVILRAHRGGKPMDAANINPGLLGDLRIVALGEILAEKAIDAKLVTNPGLYDEGETDRLVAEQETRAGGPDALDAELGEAGLTRAEFRDRMRAFVGRLRWLEKQFAASGLDTVGSEELSVWFENLDQDPVLPAALRLRHFFKPSLHREPAELENEIRDWHRRIGSGEITFETAIATASEDEETKSRDGELGWVSPVEDRWPDGLDAATLMDAPVGRLLEPMRSRLGWHLFVVMEKRAERPLSLDDARHDATAHLISRKRREGLNQILQAIIDQGKTTIDHELLRSAPITLGW